MANTINIPRSHLVMGLCLPLAVLLGYFLAEPLDSASMGVVVFVFVILAVPLLMKWHHPLLVLSWNMYMNSYFLPGSPTLWMIMAFTSLFFALLSRSVNAEHRFIYIHSLAKPLFFLLAVVLVTALFTGGVGLRSMGGERYGGRGYFYIFAAVVGFFAFTSRRIPTERAGLYVAMFFLSSLTPLIGSLTQGMGSKLLYLHYLFAVDAPNAYLADPGGFNPITTHISSFTYLSLGVYSFLLARYGIRGVFDFSKPWRGAMFLLAAATCLACGFRSALIMFALVMTALFCLEGLHRTHLLPLSVGLLLALGLAIIPLSDKLPTSVQRTLSFLPLSIDPVVKQTAIASTDWRVEIWKSVLPQVPKYLIKGKGYALDPNDLYMANFESWSSGAALSGDYHNGPLTLIIPFGIFGVIGFGWFVVAALRYLYHNFRFGDPALHRVNTFLLAAFAVKVLFFLLFYGCFWADLSIFAGLVGLSVSLNGEPQPRVQEEPVPEVLEPAH